MTLIIQLSNESRKSSDGTRYFTIAKCLGLEVAKSKGSAIRELARKLQEHGIDRDTAVIVKRGSQTVFNESPLHQWADYMLYEPDGGPMRLVKWDYEAAAKLKQQRKQEAA